MTGIEIYIGTISSLFGNAFSTLQLSTAIDEYITRINEDTTLYLPIDNYIVNNEANQLKYNLNIFDKTLILNSCREDEIFDWLERNLEITNFVVLDDRFLDSKRLGEHFIKTNGYSKGLDEESVKKAIEILNM